MENAVLKKRLNTFKSAKGTLRKVADDVVIDVLRAWERWPGSAADLYRELGMSKQQMAVMLKKGKRLATSGAFAESEFKEIAVAAGVPSSPASPCSIELALADGNVVRFGQVAQLVEFLRAQAA